MGAMSIYCSLVYRIRVHQHFICCIILVLFVKKKTIRFQSWTNCISYIISDQKMWNYLSRYILKEYKKNNPSLVFMSDDLNMKIIRREY